MFAIVPSKQYQIVFAGGVYINIDTTSLTAALSGRPNVVNQLSGEQYYDVVEYLTTQGIVVSAQQICYVKDITSDPTAKPNVIGFNTAAVPYVIEWFAPGTYVTGTNLRGIVYVSHPGTITGAFLTRYLPGTGSGTIIDIHKNGTTIWTTQANRPTLLWNDADGATSAPLPDVLNVVTGDLLSWDIDQVDTVTVGAPADLRFSLRISPTV
jgi:hypothetical protein